MADVTEPMGEARRLLALENHEILDTPSEAGFDDIATLACQICDTPVALISFVARDRQWFKARIGFDPRETPLDQSVCRHTIEGPVLLVVPDLTADARTRTNPLVTGAPHWRFYAGARLDTRDGVPLGSLCVVDVKPRPSGLTPAQGQALEALSRQVMALMDLRRVAGLRDAALRSARDSDLRQRHILESATDHAIIALDDIGRIIEWKTGAERVFGWSAEEMRGQTAERVFTPEDRASGRIGREMRLALEYGRGSDERWHLKQDGSLFWAHAEMTPLRDDDGRHLGFLTIVRDETSRREAAEKSRLSEEFLQSLLVASDDCIQVLDLEGRLVFMSEGGKRAMDLPDFDTIRGRAWPVLCPDDLRDEAAGAVQAAREGRTGTYQGPTETFAGQMKWWDVRVTAIRDADGRPEKLLAISRDVTEHKASEARRLALLDLGDQLRDLYEPAEMAFAAAKIMGRTLAGSRAGYGTVDPVAEIVVIERDWALPGIDSIAGTHAFRDFGSFIDDLNRGAIVAIDDVRHDARTASHASALEAIGIRAIVNIPLFEYGRFEAVFYVHSPEPRPWRIEQIAFVRNVADRTLAAVTRRDAELRLKALNDDLERRVEVRTRERNRLWQMTNDLVATGRLVGFLKAVNPAWTQVLGWDETELLARPFIAIVDPADQAATAEVVARLAAGQAVKEFIVRMACKDGAHRTITWNAVPDGQLFHIVGRDITEQQHVEEQLRQSQKMEAVGQLTGGVAHDFNNLLTVIRSSVDLLKRSNLPEERRQRYIEAISDTTTRAAKLTGQLLAFARRQALNPEVFDVVEDVRAIGDMVMTLTGSRMRILTLLPDAPCYVNADASQFDTALVNLAVNARDAMEGEGTLSIAVATTTMIPALRTHPAVIGAFVTVSVSDTGSGIAARDIDRIFEPFFTTKGVGHGTGLGLSQVFGFAKQSGGEVSVTSEAGKGATFTLYLPRVAGRVGRSEADDDAGLVDGQGACVLVVEDNEDVGAFATHTLTDLGYDCLLAIDAQAALAALAAAPQRFEVVFSDVVMPGMNGIDLGREIRRLYPDLPVILTSGYSHVLAQNGTSGFELLQKPYSAEQLSRAFQKAAQWRRLRRALTG